LSTDVLAKGTPAANELSANQSARRQRILDAAFGLLEGREYERIHMREVAEGASVALGTVYHYFPSKEQLFGEVMVQQAAALRSSLTRSPPRGDRPGDQLKDALGRTIAAFERRPQMGKLLSRLGASDDPYSAQVLAGMDDATYDVYLAALHQVEPEVASRIVRVVEAVLDSSLRAWSGGRVPITEVRRLVDDAVDLLVPDGEAIGPK
jgi:AcrR family transcriptional regulator